MLTLDRVSIEAEKARRDFRLFLKLAWPVIEPGRPFVPGWHLDAIAEHLQAVSEGQITRLLVNMPPRHGKSSLISVLWSGWLLLNNPSTRLLCASYALNLAIRDNVKARRLIKSNWFQQRYGHIFTLADDQDAKMKFETDKLGYRMAVSVGSAATGEGGDILLLDDPHNIQEKESEAKREAALDWFDNTWASRLNDQQTGQMVVVAHRIHAQDVSGHILDTNDGEWVHLNLPAEFEAGNPCKTYLPTGQEFWSDPRTEDGELLWSERFPQKVIDKAKRRHGPMGYAALYQQRPTPAGGAIFQSKNQRYFTVDETTQCYLLETPRGIKPVPFADCWKLCTVDLAISEKESADFTVFAAYAVTPYKDLLLLEIIREHFPFDEQLDQACLFQLKHYFNVGAIEATAYQLAMVQQAIVRGFPAKPFNPHKDKVTRSSTASIWDANGKSYHLKHAPWLFTYEKEKFGFPKEEHDDQVDTHSLAAIVVCTNVVPGVVDLNSEDELSLDDTLSIEQIIDATQIAEEQKKAAEEQAEEEKANYKPHEVINPFEWSLAHELEAAGVWE